MRCEAVRELFSEIYDKAAEGQGLLEEHLQNCTACMEEFQAYSQMLNELRHLPIPELPPGFHEAAMNKIQAISPLSNNAIDDLMEEIETRKRLREVRRTRQPVKKTASVTRRWAGIAAAACLLLVSLWAVRTLNLPARYDDESYFAPEAAMESLEMAADAQTGEAPLDGRALPDESLLPVPSEEEIAEEAPWNDTLPVDAPSDMDREEALNETQAQSDEEDSNWGIEHEPSDMAIEYGFAEMAEFEDDSIWAAGPDYYEDDDTWIGSRTAEPYSAMDIAGAGEAVNDAANDALLIDDAFDQPMTYGGESNRTWVIIVFAGLVPLCIALGFILRIKYKNRKTSLSKNR